VSNSQRAFTLIELLIVIAIIAILAAILFPVFASARDKARQTACLSNEKQIGLGIMQYVQDYDESFPVSVTATVGLNNESQMWYGQLVPYTKSSSVYFCPSDTTTKYSECPFPVSYMTNGSIMLWGSVRPIMMSQLDAPAVYGLIFETCADSNGFSTYAANMANWDMKNWNYVNAGIAPVCEGFTRHTNNRSNVICTDGHTTSLYFPPCAPTVPDLGDLGDCTSCTSAKWGTPNVGKVFFEHYNAAIVADSF